MKSFNTITIVGVGLIGGSIGLALRARRAATNVIGTGSRPATLETAQRLGAITRVSADLASAVAQAELVVVCAPVEKIVESVVLAARSCPAGTLITDAGSTKAEIVAQLDQAAQRADWPREVRFVGSHPMAGTEKKGPQHASPELFVGRAVIVTPTPQTRAEDCAAVTEFWSSLGAKVLEMTPDEHDRVVATTSHLPHLVAAALAASTPKSALPLTAGGWLDSTRIAAGDPALWRQIMLANRDNLLAALGQFDASLQRLRQAIEQADPAALEAALTEAKRVRDAANGG